MYCPNCGKENAASQSFCRSCGMGLLSSSQAVAEFLGTEPGHPHASKLELGGKLVGLTSIGLLMLMVVLLMLCLLGSKLFGLNMLGLVDVVGPVVASIAIPLLFVSAGMLIAPKVLKEILPGLRARREIPPVRDDAGRYAPGIAIPPSVTETTTARLETGIEIKLEAKDPRDTQPTPI